MYVQRYILACSREHFCHGNATIRSIFFCWRRYSCEQSRSVNCFYGNATVGSLCPVVVRLLTILNIKYEASACVCVVCVFVYLVCVVCVWRVCVCVWCVCLWCVCIWFVWCVCDVCVVCLCGACVCLCVCGVCSCFTLPIMQFASFMRRFILSSMTCLTVRYCSTLSHKQHDFRKKNYWT
jgi:hypothetical protein